MKYGKLIDFHPIEDVIQLKSADDVATGRGYVESYVVSDTLADNLVNAMINQLQLTKWSITRAYWLLATTAQVNPILCR